MADSLAKEVELPCTGNRDECHADSWLLGRLITFCVGISVAVAVAWQSYGDIVRQIVATSCEQFSSIAPRAAPIVCNTSDMIAMAAQAAPSPDGQRLGATPLLAGVPTRPPSRIGYQDVTAPIVRQEVVREGFRAHVRTGSPKWSACRYRIQGWVARRRQSLGCPDKPRCSNRKGGIPRSWPRTWGRHSNHRVARP